MKKPCLAFCSKENIRSVGKTRLLNWTKKSQICMRLEARRTAVNSRFISSFQSFLHKPHHSVNYAAHAELRARTRLAGCGNTVITLWSPFGDQEKERPAFFDLGFREVILCDYKGRNQKELRFDSKNTSQLYMFAEYRLGLWKAWYR